MRVARVQVLCLHKLQLYSAITRDTCLPPACHPKLCQECQHSWLPADRPSALESWVPLWGEAPAILQSTPQDVLTLDHVCMGTHNYMSPFKERPRQPSKANIFSALS